MLSELHIENIAVIERADVRFAEGLNVLTGETGAGKSIVIDSIGAVLGERVSRDLVRRGAENELILQRRIGADGKNSCRVCGVPVTAAQMKELAALLVDIHGQNDGRQLMDERQHLRYLDRFGSLESWTDAFSSEYRKYRAIRRDLEQMRMDDAEKERLSESLRYTIAELERAELKEGEKDGLVSRRDLLRNFEKLTDALEQALLSLDGDEENALTLAQNSAYYISRAAAIVPELDKASEAIQNAVFSLTDAAEFLRDFQRGMDFSPEEYDRLEERIALLNKLERKYNRDEDALIAYLEDCRNRLEQIEFADEHEQELRKALSAQEKLCRRAAADLSLQRKNAAEQLQKRIVSELRQLNMPSVRFAVEFVPVMNEQGFDEHGAEDLRFIMSANTGEQMGRISKIASGGELSRIMLAMKNVFAEKDPVGTMIFDEIDTGVSGIAAQRVGEKLYTVSRGKQVLCVTHLPQIAAMADSHYVISKEERSGRTYTEIGPLDREGRKHELARLHGGDHITLTTLASAEEQLEAAERFKES